MSVNFTNILLAKHPELLQYLKNRDIELELDFSEDGNPIARIAKWNCDIVERPTEDDLLKWSEKNSDLVLNPLRHKVSLLAEQIFYQLAEQITSETINALIIQEWQAKEQLVKAWIAAGKPEPTADNEFSLAYYEAQGDPEKTPTQLMEIWAERATRWRQLNVAYIAWRQDFRARLKAAQSEDEIAALSAGIDSELKSLFGL